MPSDFDIGEMKARIQGTKVTSLHLRGAGINSPDEIQGLTEALQGTNITSLDLSYNFINSLEEVRALTVGLQGTDVTELNLSCTLINSDEALAVLIAGLQNTKVTSLGFRGNCIRQMPLNRKITDIDLTLNPISAEASTNIMDQVYLNKEGNSLSAMCAVKIMRNSELQKGDAVTLNNGSETILREARVFTGRPSWSESVSSASGRGGGGGSRRWHSSS